MTTTTLTHSATLTDRQLLIAPADLLDLLTGVILATHSDSSIPTLTGILMEVSGETLTATATDRYRLITGKIKLSHVDSTGAQPGNFTALLFNKNGEEVIRALKPLVKRGDPRAILIEIEGENIRFTLPDSTFNFRLLDGTFPPFEYLLAIEEADSSAMAFNCAFLGDFGKVPTRSRSKGSSKVPVLFTFHGNSKLVTVTIAHPTIEWRGGIMPMRYVN